MVAEWSRGGRGGSGYGGAITEIELETELRRDGAKGRTLECGSPSKTGGL